MADNAALTVSDILGNDGWISTKFPNFEDRPEQMRLAETFVRAIENEWHAVTEAATGTGKSFAYLVAIAIDAIFNKRQYVVSTADKNLQRQLVMKDIPFLQQLFKDHGHELKAVLMKGRGNYLCRYKIGEMREMADLVEGLYEHAAVLERMNAWEMETDDGDMDELPFQIPWTVRDKFTVDSDSCLGRKCPAFEDCFVERRKTKARGAHIIVVNHALLLRDLAVRQASDGFIQVLPVDDTARVVLDEVHRLTDVATDAFADEYTIATYRRLRSRFEALTTNHKGADQAVATSILEAAEQVADGAAEYIQTVQDRLEGGKETVVKLGDETIPAKPLTDALAHFVRKVDGEAPFWLHDHEVEAWRKAASYAKRMAARTDAIVAPADPQGDNAVRYAERSRNLITLNRKPIDVAPILQDALWKRFSVVLCTSATLAVDSGFSPWKKAVGVDKIRAAEIVVGSPFDYRNNGMIYVPANASDFDPSKAYNNEHTASYVGRVAQEVWNLVEAANGGAFVLFTSRRMMEAVYDLIGEKLARRWLTAIQEGFNRAEITAAHREDGNAVTFGLRSFWEGIDVQGAALRLVIIDKLPFIPPNDPVFDARKDRLTRVTGNEWAWFNELAIPNAITQLKQGVGRLIRTKTDRGVVALLDGRLITKPYGQRIIKSLPPMRRTRSLDEVREFYQEWGFGAAR